jgi:hypothetical protein
MTIDQVMLAWAHALAPMMILGIGLLWALGLLYGGRR